MTIYEQIKEAMEGKQNTLLTCSEIIEEVNNRFGTNKESIIPSDYCYNRFNKGIAFEKHLFQYINRSSYKYLGEEHPFTGLIYHKLANGKEKIVGEWKSGTKILYEESEYNDLTEDRPYNDLNVSKEQALNLYEEYNNILRLERDTLECEPTELRHLIGRIGEFYCAIETNGCLSRVTNQHGFDVVSNGRRISVKTTAQSSGFISINQNTFSQFDDLFVVQYANDDFKVIYYGRKEEILNIKRDYGNRYEVEINKLKKLYKESI